MTIDTSGNIIYAKSYCVYCKKAIAFLSNRNINHIIVYLDKICDGDEIHSKLKLITNQNTVPYIFLNGKFIGGYSDLIKEFVEA